MAAVALASNDVDDVSSEDLTLGPEDEQEQECGEDEGEGGPYATLASMGALESAGSIEHPGNCQPCTFYCFTRRGCNRGADCKFCHMSHQSKLQQRREAWKKQQREKRKSIRERVVIESTARQQKSKDDVMMMRPAYEGSGGGGETQAIRLRLEAATAKPAQQMRPVMGKGMGKGLGQPQAGPCLQQDPSGLSSSLVFAYTPQRSTFTMGQFAEIVPALFGCTAVRQFSLHAPLPKGLSLDSASGVISGSPLVACPCCSVFVEVEMMDGRRAQTSLEIEVVDFTRGGFVVGHISEVEPGRFMLLLYKPEDNDADGRPSYEQSDLMAGQGGPYKKMGDFSEPGGRQMSGGHRGRNALQGEF